MARSEFDKLLAVTKPKGDIHRTDFTRLMAEVLRLTKTPKAKRGPKILSAGKIVKPESAPVRLLKAAPVSASLPLVRSSGDSDLGRLAAQVDQLRRSVTPDVDSVPVKSRTSKGTAAPASNTLNTFSKIFSTVFAGSGLGTIVSGLTRLFGGGAPDSPAPLYQFSLPQSVAVEAGVTRNGQFVPVSYSQTGQARPGGSPEQFQERIPPRSGQPMTVDSRWFLDHSEDIASAVKEAMLHSHSINDVVADL